MLNQSINPANIDCDSGGRDSSQGPYSEDDSRPDSKVGRSVRLWTFFGTFATLFQVKFVDAG